MPVIRTCAARVTDRLVDTKCCLDAYSACAALRKMWEAGSPNIPSL